MRVLTVNPAPAGLKPAGGPDRLDVVGFPAGVPEHNPDLGTDVARGLEVFGVRSTRSTAGAVS
ncbi:MAG: hypothetical protein ABW215_10095 [Kibdelosporangium sp.]